MQIVQQFVDNGDGTKTPIKVKVIAGVIRGAENMAQPAPVPVVETAHVSVRPVAEAAPVAEEDAGN